MDLFRFVGGVALGVAECTVGVVRAVVDVPLGMVKGAAYSTIEAGGKMSSVGSAAEAIGAAAVLLVSPVTGAVAGGTKEIVKAPEKVVHGVVNGVKRVFDD